MLSPLGRRISLVYFGSHATLWSWAATDPPKSVPGFEASALKWGALSYKRAFGNSIMYFLFSFLSALFLFYLPALHTQFLVAKFFILSSERQSPASTIFYSPLGFRISSPASCGTTTGILVNTVAADNPHAGGTSRQRNVVQR